MRALKTIVGTAVIVFVLSTVAMAGVQRYTSQGDKTGGAQAQQPQTMQPTSTITMTAAQLKALIGSQRDDTAEAKADRQRDRHQEKVRDRDAARTTTRDHAATQAGYASESGQNGAATCVPNDHDYSHDWGGSTDGDHSDDGLHHSGSGQHHSGDSDCR